MKNLIATTAAIVFTAGMAMADPVEGIWKTQPDDGAFATVQMSKCGDKICGTIKQAYNMQGQPIASDTKGKRLVWDMVPQGDGTYKNGKIWQPSTGKTYKSKMVLKGSTLKVSGCIGPICKSQTWSR